MVAKIRAKIKQKELLAQLAKTTNDDTVHFDKTYDITNYWIDFRIVSCKSGASDCDGCRADPLLMRVFRDDFAPLASKYKMGTLLMLSDMAALDHLRLARMPTPKYTRIDFGKYGVPFMMIEDVVAAGKGWPLSTVTPSEQEWQKVYSQLADFICGHEWGNRIHDSSEWIGRLHRYLGEIQILSIILEWTLEEIGSFDNATEYYTAWAERLLQMIADRQIFNRFPVDAFLVFRYLKELAQTGRFNSFYPNEPELDRKHFYLKHSAGITEDRIIVDDQYNIVEVKDWTLARLVPAYEAFGPQTVQLGSRSPGGGGKNVNEYIAAALEARKKANLARYFRIAQGNICSLAMDLGAGKYLEHRDFLATFQKILTYAGEIDDGEKETFSWAKWRKEHLALWADDARLTTLDFLS
jgi:hypothetical protein